MARIKANKVRSKVSGLPRIHLKAELVETAAMAGGEETRAS